MRRHNTASTGMAEATSRQSIVSPFRRVSSPTACRTFLALLAALGSDPTYAVSCTVAPTPTFPTQTGDCVSIERRGGAAK